MAATRRLTIREVRCSTDPAVGQGHQLISRTFPKAELVSGSEWRNSLRELEEGLWPDSRWHLVVAEREGAVVGLATGTYLGDVNTGVIGYLAVSRNSRGLGVGSKLRGRLRNLFRRDARELRGKPLQAIVGEVHADNPWLRKLVRRDRALALDFPYFQLRLHREARPVPLVLYYESCNGAGRRPSTALIRTLLYSIWRRTYRIAQPRSNAVCRRMLRQLAGRKAIGAIPLDELPAPAIDDRS